MRIEEAYMKIDQPYKVIFIGGGMDAYEVVFEGKIPMKHPSFRVDDNGSYNLILLGTSPNFMYYVYLHETIEKEHLMQKLINEYLASAKYRFLQQFNDD